MAAQRLCRCHLVSHHYVPDELAPSRLAEAEVDLNDAAGEMTFDGLHLHLVTFSRFVIPQKPTNWVNHTSKMTWFKLIQMRSIVKH